MGNELAYWIALAHLSKWGNKKKNEIIVRFFGERISIIDFFHLEKSEWSNIYGLSDNDFNLLEEAKSELANYAFLVEDLLEQGYKILPITSSDYSQILKNNLKRSYAPPVIYIKGNKEIMEKESVAIVGSRKACNDSLKFTDNIAQKASKETKVIVSGFAKGVDKQALDSTILHKGQSIIVLPQGITTFTSGFKKYYEQIIEGDVLVLSTFYPKAPWSVQLAMARNPIIYGLANEIFVAESDNKGGTWSGVMDGLRKGRKIYVRKPDEKEMNANNLLIKRGAIPVDILGNEISKECLEDETEISIVDESAIESVERKIIDFLKNGEYTSKEIIEKLKINWSTRKLTNYLRKNTNVETRKTKPFSFTHKNRIIKQEIILFDK